MLKPANVVDKFKNYLDHATEFADNIIELVQVDG